MSDTFTIKWNFLNCLCLIGNCLGEDVSSHASTAENFAQCVQQSEKVI